MPQSPWGACPATTHKGHRAVVATVSLGESRTLQAPGSDVSGTIPENTPGVLLLRVQTDLSSWSDVVPQEECFISPAVEVAFLQSKETKQNSHFALRLPHCLTENNLLSSVKVRKRDTFDTIREIPPNSAVDLPEDQEACFKADDTHVTIFTRSFSKFVCTSCQNICAAAVIIFLFGRLDVWPDTETTTAAVQVFCCGPLYRIVDFKQVSGSKYESEGGARKTDRHKIYFTIFLPRRI